MKLLVPFLFSSLLISGCASELNLRNAGLYAQGCQGFQAQNEWWKARRACGRAAVNAKLGGAPDSAVAALWYEYGRTSGVICEYVEAKRGLEEALKLDQSSNGPIFKDHIELARLHLDQNKYQEASHYYQLGITTIPKEQAINEDPIGYAEILEEYAKALKNNGDETSSSKLTTQANELRATNPGKKSNTDRTPYGKFCDQKS